MVGERVRIRESGGRDFGVISYVVNLGLFILGGNRFLWFDFWCKERS